MSNERGATHGEAAALTVAALDRMIESVEHDMGEQDVGNHNTIAFLSGELKGYRNARTYLIEAQARFAVSETETITANPERRSSLEQSEVKPDGNSNKERSGKVDREGGGSADSARGDAMGAGRVECGPRETGREADGVTGEGASAPSTVGIITAEPITTREELEAAYQQAIRGRHISEIAPVLALRNKALDSFFAVSATPTKGEK